MKERYLYTRNEKKRKGGAYGSNNMAEDHRRRHGGFEQVSFLCFPAGKKAPDPAGQDDVQIPGENGIC